MKQNIKLIAVALVASVTTLVGYHLFDQNKNETAVITQNENTPLIPTSTLNSPLASAASIDFTEAAEKTVHAVVHVKNTTISRQPSNIMEFFYGGGAPKAMVGAGSGVIFTPDGYIITNNHVIENASELEVTLNNNKTYQAELIGADPKTDIALIKIDADEELPFVPFGDSNAVKIGEWVLAVGNPFNLTSTVTAGIISAKSRDLNELDGNPQSFLQTDAAVNRGNSGGALVNTRGELVGINTAITSETGSYVGYSFAVPSNNARKVIEDIMEYGNVQRGILGIVTIPTKIAQERGINISEGVYVYDVEKGSGADKSGLQQGDIIKKIDGLKIGKFSDLTGYIGSKRPNDVVEVEVDRNGNSKRIPVTLVKLETYQIDDLGLEIKNVNKSELKERGISNGVEITRATTRDMQAYERSLKGAIITKINDNSINDISDVKSIMNSRDYNDPIKVTFIDTSGELNSFIFR